MDKYKLKLRQSMPLEDKIRFTKKRIEEWVNYYGEDGVYVSFSGGKDSTVLLHLVRSMYPNVEAVYVDTGLEYPELKQFVKTFDNVTILRPKMMFNQVIEKYGFPIISKKNARYIRDLQNPTEKNKYTRELRLTGITKSGKKAPTQQLAKKWIKLKDAPFKISEQCCNIMKKDPIKKFIKERKKYPFIGVMAEESNMREQEYLKRGSCNAFNLKIPQSTPLAFWTEQDILAYLKLFEVKYASVYGEILQDENGKYYTTGCKRTGCMFCGFGCHLEKEPNRFQMLKQTHPKQWDYIINKLGFKQVLDYIGVKYE